ncbi:MAG: response regulator transcription factor, partial [Streptosporangiaceae bacterium]
RLPAAFVHHDAPLGDRLPQFWQLEFQPQATGRASGVRPAVRAAAARRDPAGTRRYAELLSPGGVEDELRTSLVTSHGYWGSLGLFRSTGGLAFSEADVSVLVGVLPALTLGARSAWAASAPRPGGAVLEPGTLLLSSDGGLISQTPAARHWLTRLSSSYSMLTAIVTVLGTRATAALRTRDEDGLWISVSGARLMPAAGPASIAVTIQPATPAEITPLLLHAYRLTPRQRAVARLVLAGRSSQQIAVTLRMSPHTANDHVKAITAKIGVHSRGELTALLTGQ